MPLDPEQTVVLGQDLSLQSVESAAATTRGLGEQARAIAESANCPEGQKDQEAYCWHLTGVVEVVVVVARAVAK
jgi:hypothetical protein